jgi:hypothetical protein
MRQKRGIRWEFVLPIAVAFFVMLGSFITALLLDEESRRGFLSEGGPVEIGSVVCYGAATAALVLLWLTGRDGSFALRTSFFTALLVARELDCHTRFTSEGIFRSSFYFRDISSVPEKAVVIVILAGTAAMGIWYARSYTGRYVRGFFGRVPWVLGVALGFGLTAVGKLADSSTWMLRTVGLERSVSIEMVNVFEESAEFAGASVILVAALMYAHTVLTRRESSLG